MQDIMQTQHTSNPPTNIVPTNIAWLKLSGKSPMDMRIPPLRIKSLLESIPSKPKLLIGRLGVMQTQHTSKCEHGRTPDLH